MKKVLIIEDEKFQVQGIIVGLGLLKEPLTRKEAVALNPKQKHKIKKTNLRNWFSQEDLYKRSIEKFKPQVLFQNVSNLKDAEKICKKTQFDVVVLDGNLTDGSTEKLFSLFENKDIVLPHSSMMSFLEKAKKFGFKNTFYKGPILEDEKYPLINKIFELIK